MKTKTEQVAEVPTVYCSRCRHCKRDTNGLSFSIETGEYFMGTCGKGIGDCGASPRVFLNKPRHCDSYRMQNNN